MPPAKKKKPAAAALKPKEAHFARLETALKKYNGKGSMLIMGVKSEDDDDDDDDEEEEDDQTEYTADQIARLRHIIINDSRDAALKAGHSFASCGQSDEQESDEDSGFAMFGTSDGNTVILGMPGAIKKALKKPTAAGQFDALFGLTHGLKSFDSWMNDNELWQPALLTSTPRGLGAVRTCVPASCVAYVPKAQGSLPRGSTVRAPASGVPYVPRTVASQGAGVRAGEGHQGTGQGLEGHAQEGRRGAGHRRRVHAAGHRVAAPAARRRLQLVRAHPRLQVQVARVTVRTLGRLR